MYNPINYWSNRENPSPNPVPDFVEDYFNKHLQGETLLDFGVGTGRMLHLYKGFEVTGYDITDNYINECMAKLLSLNIDFKHAIGYWPSENYDIAVASKVLLHLRPDNVHHAVDMLRVKAKKVIVWDAIGQNAEHVFSHDYQNMQDAMIKDNELLFTWT